MKEYKFEVKMYAYIPIKAPDLKAAELAIESAMDQAELRVPISGPDGSATILDVPVFVDDIEFPYLSEVDGVAVEDIDDLDI
jgi:hypothetical protein